MRPACTLAAQRPQSVRLSLFACLSSACYFTPRQRTPCSASSAPSPASTVVARACTAPFTTRNTATFANGSLLNVFSANYPSQPVPCRCRRPIPLLLRFRRIPASHVTLGAHLESLPRAPSSMCLRVLRRQVSAIIEGNLAALSIPSSSVVTRPGVTLAIAGQAQSGGGGDTCRFSVAPIHQTANTTR